MVLEESEEKQSLGSWCEAKMPTFILSLRVFTSAVDDQCRNCISFYIKCNQVIRFNFWWCNHLQSMTGFDNSKSLLMSLSQRHHWLGIFSGNALPGLFYSLLHFFLRKCIRGFWSSSSPQQASNTKSIWLRSSECMEGENPSLLGHEQLPVYLVGKLRETVLLRFI